MFCIGALSFAPSCWAEGECSSLLLAKNTRIKSQVKRWLKAHASGVEGLNSGKLNTVLRVLSPFWGRLKNKTSYDSTYEVLYQDPEFAEKFPILSLNPNQIDITFFPDSAQITDCPAYARFKGIRICELSKSAPEGDRLMDEVPAESSRGLLSVPYKYVSERAGLSYDYFAHEFGHLLHFNFMSLHEVARLHHLYQKALADGRILDDYAASDESEYFAQGLEAFFSSDGKDKVNYIYFDHTPSELRRKDPDLYAFIEDLILSSNRQLKDHSPRIRRLNKKDVEGRRFTQIVIGILKDDTDQVLLGRRQLPQDWVGFWELPGGKVEDKESAQEALVREFKEETGLDVQVGKMVMQDFQEFDGKLLRIQFYQVYSDHYAARSRVYSEMAWVAKEQVLAHPFLVSKHPIFKKIWSKKSGNH